MRICLSSAVIDTRSRRYICDKSGIGAIEFAIIAPFLILMFTGLADLGLAIYENMQVDGAAQYGAQFALVNGYDSSAISSAVQSSTDLSPLTVTSSSFSGCPGTSGVQAQAAGLCGDGSTTGTFTKVSVTHTYTTLIPYPGLPSSFTLSSQATVRLK